MFRNLPSLTKGLIIAIIASALLSMIVPSLTVSVLPLFPQLLLHGQLWRLITFPFFLAASIHNLLASVFVVLWNGVLIAMFGGELETIVHTRQLTIALAIAVLVGGILFAIFSSTGALAGPGVIAMFMLGGFSYLWPKREISIFGLFWVKAWMIALAVYILSIIPMSGMQLDTSASNLFGPTYGALAAIVYFHLVYRQYSFGRGFLDRTSSLFSRSRKPVYDATNPKSIQARIDAILDKIASSGMQSLSKEEREFLLKHSQ